MPTDVHQQRLSARKQQKDGRRCDSCGVWLWPSESAHVDSHGAVRRIDRCLHCCVDGPPRRPQPAPVNGGTGHAHV